MTFMPNSHHSFNGSSTSSHKVPIPYAMHVAPLCIKYRFLTQRISHISKD
ncbi:hypothetical protein HMPREF0769_11897 [Staphylococcus aureus subsp. aureus MN8]|uniref:Uncharacterized protein n=1 Tax=Staphylococcus aureus subsp. aureus MN8 TaxID=548470 RepID=A0A0E1XEQ8_STAAU|nr:hypothetical protein HMPREF0769_11897 [Staphylococcus aureus subsp. aureus MN8]